ncbi:MAG: MBL fold metallo-hydrolase [Verrucomicrobiota bacterium]
MKVKLWGTRGSIPTPSTTTFKTSLFGGDTTSLTVESRDKLLIFDAGSGARHLGLDLMKRKVSEATFFFTHVHWDHIQGFPFFMPAFVPANKFTLYGPNMNPKFKRAKANMLERALRDQQHEITFPIKLDQMPASMTFKNIDENEAVEIKVKGGKLIIRPRILNHPGGSFGYRIEEHLRGKPVKIFTLATDTEHFVDLNPNVQDLAQDADLMIYDCQYNEDEYSGKNSMPKKGWGHSTWNWGLQESAAANVKQMLLFHHDPMHDDKFILNLERQAKASAKKLGIRVAAARQFSEFDI